MRGYLLLVGTLLLAAPIAAQGRGPVGLHAYAAAPADPHWTPSFPADSVPGSHWKEGMIDGALIGTVLTVLAAVAFNASCDTRECGIRPLEFVLPIALFSLVGGLIGSLSPKP